jgi:hypothetical protein
VPEGDCLCLNPKPSRLSSAADRSLASLRPSQFSALTGDLNAGTQGWADEATPAQPSHTHPAACPDHRDVADMPHRTTRANLSNPPNLEPMWIRSTLTALTQRLSAVTDASATCQESTRYFRSGRTVAQHGTGRVRAGNTIPRSAEAQPAGALGFWPSSHSNDRASATVTRTQLRKKWPDELHTQPACRNGVSIAPQSMLQIPQLALARSLPAINSKRVQWRTPYSR